MRASGRPFLGIFVHPADVQNEGLARVFDTLGRVGTDAIAFTANVAWPVESGGKRFPELHIDGHRRVLARPMFGRTALNLAFARCVPPDPRFYPGRYRPAPPAIPAGADAATPMRMLEEAQRRGLQGFLHIAPFLPPGIAEEDRPMRVDGLRQQSPRISGNACLNSPEARAYARGLLAETAAAFPRADGIFLDWAEYGAYLLDDHFSCFCPHCRRAAAAKGYDVRRMAEDTRAVWERIGRLTATDLRRIARDAAHGGSVAAFLAARPGLLDLLRFKADTVAEVYAEARQVLDAAGAARMILPARGWAPPWNLSSGFDYARLAALCPVATPKLFLFDYGAMPRWHAEAMQRINPGLPEGPLLEALLALLDLPDDRAGRRLSDYVIPEPEALHPARLGSHFARVDRVAAQLGSRAVLRPFAHAYAPPVQWREQLVGLFAGPADGLWVQMYGYLSDAHLEILAEERDRRGDARG